MKIEAPSILASKVKRVLILVVLVTGTTILIFGCERSAKKASLQLPLIPETDPLAQPKSLQQVGAPVEMTHAAIPADNPQTPEKISLGQRLFFDRRLSANGAVSCSTCHDPALAFTDRKPTSVGVQGRVGQRNAPTVLNALYNKTQFWDGRVNTLEEQAALPIVNSVEMGHPNLDAAVAQIAAIGEYQQAFRAVFGRPPNGPDLVRAIASYERTQLSFDSPFDHFIAGDKNAIDESAKRGWELFNNQARCNKCHALTETTRDVTNLIDNDFHNIGILFVQHKVVPLARQAEQLTLNQYRAGTADFSAVILAQTARFNAENTALAVLNQRLSGSTNLIVALGGGWDTSRIPQPKGLYRLPDVSMEATPARAAEASAAKE